MCYKRTCSICGKATYSGCGKHVEQVLEGIPEEARCQGHKLEEEDTDPDS